MLERLAPAVLIVDDEPSVRDVVARMVQRLGYRPCAAECGPQALALFHAHSPSAAILDVRMPGMDGPNTMAALHALAPSLPCMFITGYSGAYTRDELLRSGAALVLDKPVTLGTLGDALAHLLPLRA